MEIGKRRSSKERRALAIDAVIDLASGMNPADITTAAISERMGLTQGALFRHFPTKDAVLQAVKALGQVKQHYHLDTSLDTPLETA